MPENQVDFFSCRLKEMEDHAYSFYCKTNSWERCEDKNLIVVKILKEEFDSDNVCTEREIIYRCHACGGFYKRRYRAIYYPVGLFDTEEGWDIEDKYFKIEEPGSRGLRSTLYVPFTLGEARSYGYAGADHTWKNGRCNFQSQNVELTCRAADLRFIAYRSPELNEHNHDKFYKCDRCGEWYLFKILPPYTEALLKPSNEHFPIESARAFGYYEP